MGEAKAQGDNFILVRTMTPREVVSLLLGRFPSLRDLICPDEYCFEEPTRVYDSFASQVIKRAGDREFFGSVIRFIDEIAESKDPLLNEVLIISLLEGIAADPDVARKAVGALGENARTLLREVEKKIYGRQAGGDPGF